MGSLGHEGSIEGDRGSQGVDLRIAGLASELVTASGNFGLRADKLDKSDTLLGLRAVREEASHKGLTTAQAALEVVREAVDGWPDKRGRLILRAALGFDHGTARGRSTRLDLLMLDLSNASPRQETVTVDSLDTLFTHRLAYDLATSMIKNDRSIAGRSRSPWILCGAAAASLLVGLGIFLVLRGEAQPEPDGGLVFLPIPAQCSIEDCNSENTAILARTGGFTPSGSVSVEIFAPSGTNANDLGGVYGYNDELAVNEQGSFTWRYWWDPGMKVGVYRVRVADQSTGQAVEAAFEFIKK